MSSLSRWSLPLLGCLIFGSAIAVVWSRHETRSLFIQLQGERGISFFVATHNPELARKADRGYRLVDGLAREIDPAER